MTQDIVEEFAFRNPIKQVGFAQLAHVLALDPELSDGAYRTLAIYIKYAQQKRDCWPSAERVARDRGKSMGTISRHNAELVALGYITRKRRLGKSTKTIIEDFDQIPRLLALAQAEIDGRSEDHNNVMCKVTKTLDQTLQKCDVEEEQSEEESEKNKNTSSPLDEFFPRSGDNGDTPEEKAKQRIRAALDTYFEQNVGKPAMSVPAEAGGADDWAGCVDAFARDVAGIDPQHLPPSKRKDWRRVLKKVGDQWRAGPNEMQTVIETIPRSALNWKTYTSPYQAEEDLGTLIGQYRSGGVKLAKEKGNGPDHNAAVLERARQRIEQERETIEMERSGQVWQAQVSL